MSSRTPGPGRRWAISVDGGDNPIWSPDGRQLFYRHDDRMMAVQVRTGEEFDAGEPVELFEGRYALGQGRPNYDVSPDGQRFVMISHGAGRAARSPARRAQLV